MAETLKFLQKYRKFEISYRILSVNDPLAKPQNIHHVITRGPTLLEISYTLFGEIRNQACQIRIYL